MKYLTINRLAIGGGYGLIADITYSFMLEAFVFISGYLFGYQISKRGLKFDKIIYGKFQRLIVPSIIFSIIYLLIFSPSTFYTYKHLINSVISGAGHMWFLPMLFWCFLFTIIIERLHMPTIPIGIIIVISSSVLSINLPFRISNAIYYMIFFWGGYIIMRNNINYTRIVSPKYIVLFFIVYCITFGISLIASSSIFNYCNTHDIVWLGNIYVKVIRLIYSSCGLFACFLLFKYLVDIKQLKIPQILLSISKYCFGIYLLQQFLLKYFYYHTNLPDEIGVVILPWGAFFITLGLCLVSTHYILKTRIGRLLIG